MTVDPARAAGSVEHNGTTYYFCSKYCVEKFRAAPEKYLAGHREAMGPALVNIGVGAAPKPRTVKDPVCGMDVVPEKAAGSVQHAGKTHHFCSKHCAEKFSANPEKYLAPEPARAGAKYICPMD